MNTMYRWLLLVLALLLTALFFLPSKGRIGYDCEIYNRSKVPISIYADGKLKTIIPLGGSNFIHEPYGTIIVIVPKTGRTIERVVSQDDVWFFDDDDLGLSKIVYVENKTSLTLRITQEGKEDEALRTLGPGETGKISGSTFRKYFTLIAQSSDGKGKKFERRFSTSPGVEVWKIKE